MLGRVTAAAEPSALPGVAPRALHLLAHLILPRPCEAGAIIIPNLHGGTNWPGGEGRAWPLDLADLGSSPGLPLAS